MIMIVSYRCLHRHGFAQSGAYLAAMKEEKRDTQHVAGQMAKASPQTRKVLWLANLWFLVTFAISMVAGTYTWLFTIGIYTHPPFWVFPLAHGAAIFGGLASAYWAMYVLPDPKWHKGAMMALMCYATTLSAIGWALPVLSMQFVAYPVQVEAKVVGAASTSRQRARCRNSVSFGSWYATGGGTCTGHPYSKALIGSTMRMQGMGNTWATRITKINSVYRH